MNLGAAIKEIRKAKRIKKKDLAAASGISVTALHNIETDKSMPSARTIKQLCQALEIPVSYMLVFSVTQDDVPEEKRSLFRQLMPIVKQLLLLEEDEK